MGSPSACSEKGGVEVGGEREERRRKKEKNQHAHSHFYENNPLGWEREGSGAKLVSDLRSVN